MPLPSYRHLPPPKLLNSALRNSYTLCRVGVCPLESERPRTAFQWMGQIMRVDLAYESSTYPFKNGVSFHKSRKSGGLY